MFELVKLIVGLVTLYFVAKSVNTSPNKYIAFILFALWLRFFLSAFHTLTFSPLIAGLSINALGSIGIVGIGIFIIPTAYLRLKKLLPVYSFLIIIFFSALYNAEYSGLIKVLVKWFYFLTIFIMFYLSLKASGLTETCKRALIPFAMPVALQLLSVVFGEVKSSESDGSASYIGGYHHEAVFSMMLVAFVMLIGMLPRKTIRLQSMLFFTGVLFILLANYRTAILAVLPVMMIFIYSSMEQRIDRRYKLPVFIFSGILLLGLFSLFFTLQQERFQDISIVLSNFETLVKPPEHFSLEERRLFSSRIYLWSQYLTEFANADTWNKLLGFGPESWSGVFHHYAHNTYVSYIYEFGYLGIISFILLNSFVLVTSWLMKNRTLSKRVFFSLVGFLIMNLATMPIWAIEGLIVYAILFGLTFANPGQSDLRGNT